MKEYNSTIAERNEEWKAKLEEAIRLFRSPFVEDPHLSSIADSRWHERLAGQCLATEVLRLRKALEVAAGDLERIRDANWEAPQMRLGAKSGAFLARKALNEIV